MRRIMTAVAAMLLSGGLVSQAWATNHGAIYVLGGRAELAPSGEELLLDAQYSGLGPDSEVSVLIDDPGDGVHTVVDTATLPPECEPLDNGFLCPVEGTGSVSFGVTATVTDSEAECPINASTTLPDPCFVVGGATYDPSSSTQSPLPGPIITMRPADDDQDGIDDGIDSDPTTFSSTFDNRPDGTTYGTVLDRPGFMEAYVSDLASGGVEVIVRPMSGDDVTMQLCGESGSTAFSAGARATVTCGSVTVAVTSGTVIRELGGGVTLTIGEGSTATTNDNGTVVVQEGSAVLETSTGSQTITPDDDPVSIGDDAPDADSDGLPDAIDPDVLWEELTAIVDDGWANNGASAAVRSILDDVQEALLLDDVETAVETIGVLLKRSDGGRGDWMGSDIGPDFHAAVESFVSSLED